MQQGVELIMYMQRPKIMLRLIDICFLICMMIILIVLFVPNDEECNLIKERGDSTLIHLCNKTPT